MNAAGAVKRICAWGHEKGHTPKGVAQVCEATVHAAKYAGYDTGISTPSTKYITPLDCSTSFAKVVTILL